MRSHQQSIDGGDALADEVFATVDQQPQFPGDFVVGGHW
jgi:hypothetical protein